MSTRTQAKARRATANTAKANRLKKKSLPTCTKKDLRTKKKSKRRACVVPKAKTPTKVSPSGGAAALPVTHPSAAPAPTSTGTVATVVVSPVAAVAAPATATPAPAPAGSTATPAPSVTPAVPVVVRPPGVPIAVPATRNGVRTYQGTFGVEQATRLLYRGGFGPKPGQAEAFAAQGLGASVDALVNPGPVTLEGPAPTGDYLVDGKFAPADRWGHMHLAFLDRAVRSTDSLGERMTLVMHDWLPVSEQSVDAVWVWTNINLLRSSWRGSFRDTMLAVTSDPGMLWFLSGLNSMQWAPNENYARELMELFTLGADRGAYTETDVREMARAMTGFTLDWNDAQRGHNFRFEPGYHDAGTKTLFAGTSYAKTGALTWQDGVNAVIDHPMHPSFVVRKLWSYFVPTAPDAATQQALEALYRSSGERLLPLVEAILLHPDLYIGPTMVKNPTVYTAGLMRARNQQMTVDSWAWMSSYAGQMIGWPTNVSGWNDQAWLNTATNAARWGLGAGVLQFDAATAVSYRGRTETADAAVAAALAFWGNPPITTDVLAALGRVAAETWSPGQIGDQYWSLENFLAQRQNALRQMIAVSADFQVS